MEEVVGTIPFRGRQSSRVVRCSLLALLIMVAMPLEY